MEAKFEFVGDDIFVDGNKVIRMWASPTNWYWSPLKISENRIMTKPRLDNYRLSRDFIPDGSSKIVKK